MLLIGCGGGVFFGHDRKAVETDDAFASELFDQIAQKEIHFISGGKGVDLAEQLGGDNFGTGNVAPGMTQPYVAETNAGAGVQDGQAASAPVDCGMGTLRLCSVSSLLVDTSSENGRE